MSDDAVGPGWWLASDGRWYPPETHPSIGGLVAEPASPRAAASDHGERTAVALATGPPPPDAAERSPGIPAPAAARSPAIDDDLGATRDTDLVGGSVSDDDPVFPWGREEPRFEEAPPRRWRRWWVITGTCLLLLACSGAAVMLLVDDGPRLTGRVEEAPAAGPPAVRPTTGDPDVGTGGDGPGDGPAISVGELPADAASDAPVEDGSPPTTWRGRREGDRQVELDEAVSLGGVGATAHRVEEVVDPSPVDPGRFLRIEVSIENTGTDLRLYNERLDFTLVDGAGAGIDPATPATPSLGAGVLAPDDDVVGWVYFPIDGLADGEAHVVYEPDTSVAARAVWVVPG